MKGRKSMILAHMLALCAVMEEPCSRGKSNKVWFSDKCRDDSCNIEPLSKKQIKKIKDKSRRKKKKARCLKL